ncbi:glutathione peroxidase (plasmid) [Legionella adelaidensis]|uniref:Glutathione peroxidase n=1 Tax=Legionella adelaidensis TaxID=45056 RepID=A0A0W0R0X4_9GAMM|nr:glutathione peroxidase [Legionella adelaidensis]KTC64685.1 glutathione peroxidase [Legionella adelaidensis]VEH86153.1 glutathione peroxidase [Legionella adelaidensis]
MQTELYNIPLNTIEGKPTTLQPFAGKVLLIVNVASRCGFTPQYKELEELYEKHKDEGLVILGFPCDQFLHQEPGSNQEIKAFAESCFRVTFPLFEKTKVKGKEKSELYRYLYKNIRKKPLIFIPWNFTKILIDQEGNVLQRFSPTTSFEKVEAAIKNLL